MLKGLKQFPYTEKKSVCHQYPGWKKADLRKGMIENNKSLKKIEGQPRHSMFPIL